MNKNLTILLLTLITIFGCSKQNKKDNFDLHKKNIQIKSKSPLEATQKNLLDEHNKQRKLKGLEELILSNDLCEYAQKHADKMAKKDNLYHSQISKIESEWVGENVAWGQETESSVVNSWMWSPMHRSNILGSKYKKVGFGVAKNKNGRNYWCTVFTN